MKKNKWLFCDVGNSYTDFLLTDFKEMSRIKAKTPSEYDKALDELFSDEEYKGLTAYVASVNQKGFDSLVDALIRRNIVVKFLTKKRMQYFVKTNNYKIENLDVLGQDLFCDLIATESRGFRIIVDVGTATKILAIDERDKFLGGTIFAGPELEMRALYEYTDLVGDEVMMKKPYLLSLDTKECLNSGALYGQAASITNIIRMIIKDLELSQVTIYLTGGGSKQLKKYLKLFGLNQFVSDSNLTIKGLARAFEFSKYDKLNWKDDED